MKIALLTALWLALCLSLTGGGAAAEESYTRIDQETALQMMARDDGHVVVDVRRADEYDAGHIPGAILIPNESIDGTAPEALPDCDQIILIYCRSGNRSRQAAGKLADMGYSNIYEFGGILTWPGEIVTTAEEAARAQAKIRVTDGERAVVYRLNDTPPARSLLNMLPLDIAVENYGHNEKIFYPEQPLDTEGGLEGGGEAGALALFSPWGNVVMYYGSFGAWPGLYLLGEAVEGADQVAELTGTIHIEVWEGEP